MSSNEPTISVVIPHPPGMPACRAVEGLQKVDYPAERIELILTVGHQPSRQRNLAVAESVGELIYFLDNDSEIYPDAFRCAVAHLNDPAVAGVGGPNLAADPRTFVEWCIGMVLASRAGTSRVRSKYFPEGEPRVAREYDVILCNLCLRRRAFEQVGGFDERLYPNEETEMFSRMMAQQVGHIVYDPGLLVKRGRPRTLLAFARKIFHYGRGRMEQTLLAPAGTTLVHLAPACLVALAAAMLMMPHPWLSWLAWLYVLLMVGGSLYHALKARRLKAFPVLAACYPLTHFAYGLGLWWGLVRAPFRLWRPRATAVELRRCKGLGERWPEPSRQETNATPCVALKNEK